MPGVVADSTEVKLKSRIAQCKRRDTGNADVDGVTEDVHAVPGHTARRFMEKCIGLRGAIAADDVDGPTGVTNGLIELVEQIEEAGIHVAIFVNAPVTEEAIEPCLSRGQVVISLAVDNVKASPCVQVVKHKAVIFGRGGLRCGWENREEREE